MWQMVSVPDFKILLSDVDDIQSPNLTINDYYPDSTSTQLDGHLVPLISEDWTFPINVDAQLSFDAFLNL